MKKTPWFPETAIPVRNGWYETISRNPRYIERRYWKDIGWYLDSEGHHKCLFQRWEWRGLQGDEHSLQIGANTYLVEFGDEGPDRPGDDE